MSGKKDGSLVVSEELRQQLLRGIVASSLDAMISIDSDQRVVMFNSAAERMFQVSAEEVLGQPLERFIPERFREAYRKSVEEFRRTGVSLRHMGAQGIVKGFRADGDEFPAEASISDVEAGGRKFYTAIVRDISERARVEDELREVGARFSLAVETAQVGTYERDILKNEVRLNGVCREIFGLKEGVPPPDIARQAPHPEDRERVLALVARAFDPALREVCAAEFRVVRPDGSVRWVAGRGRVVFDERAVPAQPLRFLGVLVDITERKEAEAELLRTKQELASANAALELRMQERTAKLHEMIAELEHMSYSMIHDMRAPLRAIQSFGEILERDAQIRLSKEAHHLLEKIRTASQRMDLLITGALSYSETVRKPLPVGPANVLQLLRDLLATYPEFNPPHAEVTLEGTFPWVKANEAGLAQCFAELIRNGVKFVEPGKPARVRVWAERVSVPEAASASEPSAKGEYVSGAPSRGGASEWVRVFFEDNGTGIPESGRNRIFDMFQRLHGPEYPGAGVGLALVRKVAERMGGQVGVESEEGKGSRFWLKLPRPSAAQGNSDGGPGNHS